MLRYRNVALCHIDKIIPTFGSNQEVQILGQNKI